MPQYIRSRVALTLKEAQAYLAERGKPMNLNYLRKLAREEEERRTVNERRKQADPYTTNLLVYLPFFKYEREREWYIFKEELDEHLPLLIGARFGKKIGAKKNTKLTPPPIDLSPPRSVEEMLAPKTFAEHGLTYKAVGLALGSILTGRTPCRLCQGRGCPQCDNGWQRAPQATMEQRIGTMLNVITDLGFEFIQSSDPADWHIQIYNYLHQEFGDDLFKRSDYKRIISEAVLILRKNAWKR